MKKFITNKYVLFILGSIFTIFVWLLASLLFDKNSMVFPSPFVTFPRLFELLKESYTYICLGNTLLRMVLGFLLSFLLAFILGVLAGNNEHFYNFMKPFFVTIRSIPTVAIVFLLIAIVVPKNAPIYVVGFISLPILYEAVVAGIKSVNKELINASKVDGADIIKSHFFIKIPLAIPYILVGIISSFGMSFKIEIMAEVITGYTKNGLGSVIQYSQKNDPTDMTTILAYSLLAVLMMLFIKLLSEISKSLIKKHYLYK